MSCADLTALRVWPGVRRAGLAKLSPGGLTPGQRGGAFLLGAVVTAATVGRDRAHHQPA